MLSAIFLDVIMLCIIMLRFVMLGVVMLNVIMLSVMAPTVACGVSHQKPQKQMLSGLLKNVLVLSMEEYQL